jgi:hypothetical protein
MARETILYDVGEDGVATVTFNRPDVLNATNDAFYQEFQALIREMAADDAVRAIILTGAGRGFCAGADVKAMNPDAGPLVRRRRHRWILSDVLRPLATLEKPVIAAVNGPAVGAGFNLALACDILIASEAAVFSQIFARLGTLGRQTTRDKHLAPGNTKGLPAKTLEGLHNFWIDFSIQRSRHNLNRARIGHTEAVDKARCEPLGFHFCCDRLSPAMHKDRVDAHRFQKHNVAQKPVNNMLFLHRRAAILDDKSAAPEFLDIWQGLDKALSMRFGCEIICHFIPPDSIAHIPP